MDPHHGLGSERACRLSNTTHSEIAPSLSLPSLPVCFGAGDQHLRLRDASVDQPEILADVGAIADLLSRCDISYLNLRETAGSAQVDCEEWPRLYSEVLKYDREAFRGSGPGPLQEQSYRNVAERKSSEHNVLNFGQTQREHGGSYDNHLERKIFDEPPTSAVSRKSKIKKKETESAPLSTGPGFPDHEGTISTFCEMVEDFCGRGEIPDDVQEAEGTSLPLADIKELVNKIMAARSKNILQLIPLDTLVRLINVLERQVQLGQGLSIDGNESPCSYSSELVLCALESTHAALAIITHHNMPKQLYNEEVIERILDFSRHHIMECITASNPLYRGSHKLSGNGAFDGEEDEYDDMDDNSVGKKRRYTRSVNMKKSTGNKISAAVYSVVQKLCTILGFLKDLLSVERLSDGFILQLAKTSFSTLLVDNIQLLQLKSIDLICGVFASYTQHRSFLIDEMVQLLWKLQFSKRALRAYHLPDVEQKQIQMITALFIQLVQFSAILPEKLKTSVTTDTILATSIDENYPSKCYEAATEACCLFWTGVLQRLAAAKPQDASDYRLILENLVMDLLTTLNLPEYPASAPVLEVLCVLLLQNAGLKSKDISARCMAIDLLGTIAARMKRDAVVCSADRFWIGEESINGSNDGSNDIKDVCSVCLNGKCANIVCQDCQRCFHADCVGAAGQEHLLRDWSCIICLCKKQLSVLRSCCKLQSSTGGKKNTGVISKSSGPQYSINGLEVIQQILLNYLQEAGPHDDANLFTRWFYLCLWYKDDPLSQDKASYYFARLNSKAILRDCGNTLLLSRDWAKKICLALGLKNSFSRGFDKILSLLLASLRENSSVLRAKALRAVSVIVEADPEVLCDKNVQCAVEGRFCDTAISVREAALELVGRHIASHPDVGLKYFEKVAERIKDTGVSVRKRAIRIIRDLCTSNAKFSGSTSAFIEIISRVTDDESSIQDLVCKTFYELWFEEPCGSQIQFVGDGSSVPTEVAKKTEQIVDMLRKLPNHQLLVTIVKRNLTLDFLPQSAKATGINAVSLATVRKRCELMCRRLLERILQVEEGNSDEEEAQALPYVMALHAFCLVDPMLCAPATDPSQFVVTLQPYLKSKVDNKSIAQLLEIIVFVIDAVLPLLRKPPKSVIEELEQDLKHMIVRHSFMTVVHACIKCICSLSKISSRSATSIEQLIAFFSRLLQGQTSNNKQLIGRSLFCLGLLLRYGNEWIISNNCESFHIANSLPLLRKYLQLDDFGLKVRALQALGYTLIAKPEYMLENNIKKILEASLSPAADIRIKMQVLQNLHEYLIDAESQLGKNGISKAETQHPGDGGNKVPEAAGAGDTNCCGGIIQLYWNSILEKCLDEHDQIRQSALKIVEIVLRQGLVHPITCVPYLVALEIDPQESNSKLAHHLLMNMNEKYPAFFESRLGDGLQMSFRFSQYIASNNMLSDGKSLSNAIAYVRPGISRIYRLIRANRASRNKFMHSIVRKFESGSRNHSPITFLVYCTEILGSLPFTCPDEPLYLIYDINRVIQIRAGSLEASMKIWSCFSQKRDLLKHPGETDEVMEHCEVHHTSGHVSTETAEKMLDNTCGISEDALQNFQSDCHDAIALQLLLRLKRHLKIVYSLNDSRCQAFSLKEHPKPGESISKQNVPFNVSGTPIRLPTSYQDMVEKYHEFKTSLKEDSLDYATYTSSIKRKRPASKSSRVGKVTKGRVHGEGEDGDDDDEDWTGGPRRLDFSDQKSNGGRVTRRRL